MTLETVASLYGSCRCCEASFLGVPTRYRGGSRISEKGVHLYKGGGSLC